MDRHCVFAFALMVGILLNTVISEEENIMQNSWKDQEHGDFEPMLTKRKHIDKRFSCELQLAVMIDAYNRLQKQCAPATPCPSGFIPYPQTGKRKFCYKAHIGCKTWNVARSICKNEGGDLIVLKNELDFLYFRELGKSTFGGNCGNFGFWIGASDIGFEGSYKWVDGSSMNLGKYWGPGQPDNQGNEDCIHVWKAVDYKLNDAYCSRSHVAGFFCAIAN